MIESKVEMKADLFPWEDGKDHQVGATVRASNVDGKIGVYSITLKRLDDEVVFNHTEWLRLVKTVADLARGAKDTLNRKD